MDGFPSKTCILGGILPWKYLIFGNITSAVLMEVWLHSTDGVRNTTTTKKWLCFLTFGKDMAVGICSLLLDFFYAVWILIATCCVEIQFWPLIWNIFLSSLNRIYSIKMVRLQCKFNLININLLFFNNNNDKSCLFNFLFVYMNLWLHIIFWNDICS